MKPLAKSYLMTALAGAALLAAGCATAPTSKEAGHESAASRVVTAYQVSDLLAQAGPLVSRSLSQNLPAEVSAADRTRLDGIVRQAYKTERLRSQVVTQLEQQAAASGHEKSLAAAADILEKPLARRMIGLENKVNNPDFTKGFDDFLKQPESAERKKRLQIVNRIAGDLQVVSLQTDFNITLLEAMIRARNDAVPAGEQLSEPHIQRIITNTRKAIAAKLGQQVPLMLLYVYRNVDTDTLQRYAGMQSQPAMRWTNQALERAIVKTLARAGQQIPQQFDNKD